MSTAACVCMVDGKWRCGVHGTITAEKRAAARYGAEVGETARERQERLAGSHFCCCGEPHEFGQHEQRDNYQPPVEVHTDQESLL